MEISPLLILLREAEQPLTDTPFFYDLDGLAWAFLTKLKDCATRNIPIDLNKTTYHIKYDSDNKEGNMRNRVPLKTFNPACLTVRRTAIPYTHTFYKVMPSFSDCLLI
jgi:hypothetical protein